DSRIIRESLGLTAPFITESGSGIFTPVSHNPFNPALGEKDGDYYVEILGCPYVQARAGLRVIANIISHPLKGFGDFTVDQLKRFSKVSEEVAHQAKAREFSEPFMTPKAVEAEALTQAAEEMGFEVVLRSPEEGRFSELIGAGAGIVPAIQRLVSAYQKQLPEGEVLQVVGVSDHADDHHALAKVYSQGDQSVSWAGLAMSPGSKKPVNQLSDDDPGSWLSVAVPLLSDDHRVNTVNRTDTIVLSKMVTVENGSAESPSGDL
ncbi:MAG: hypothetical protein AAFP03_18980, partial [Cyanobacteria bacterium J06598_3]